MSLHKPYVVALIPARSGSKGIENKNLRTLHDRSLLDWSISAARKTQNISRVVVSTNSSEYAEVAKKAGAEVPFLRPGELAQDSTPEWHAWKHALNYLKDF